MIHHQYWKGMERLPLQILDVRRFMVVHLQIVSLRLSEILAQLGASCSNKFLQHLQLPPSPNNALIQSKNKNKGTDGTGYCRMSCEHQEKAQLTKDESDSTDSDSGQAPSCQNCSLRGLKKSVSRLSCILLFRIVFLIFLFHSC